MIASSRRFALEYHHGDARNALVAAAGELLERAGAAGLPLRQVAERAALSRQAPYNHFTDKEALLAQLARAGFERLTAALRQVTTGLHVARYRLLRGLVGSLSERRDLYRPGTSAISCDDDLDGF